MQTLPACHACVTAIGIEKKKKKKEKEEKRLR